MFTKNQDTTNHVMQALEKGGYNGMEFRNARYVKQTATQEVHKVWFFNDHEDKLDSGYVYIDLKTGKGDF